MILNFINKKLTVTDSDSITVMYVSNYTGFTDGHNKSWHKFKDNNGNLFTYAHTNFDLYFAESLQEFSSFQECYDLIQNYLHISVDSLTNISDHISGLDNLAYNSNLTNLDTLTIINTSLQDIKTAITNGQITKVAVSAVGSATSLVNNTATTLAFTTTSLNQGSMFNGTTFTATRSMIANLRCTASITNSLVTFSTILLSIYVNGSLYRSGILGQFAVGIGIDGLNTIHSEVFDNISLTAGQTITIKATQRNSTSSTKTLDNVLLTISEI